jgi:hypothetical protein
VPQSSSQVMRPDQTGQSSTRDYVSGGIMPPVPHIPPSSPCTSSIHHYFLSNVVICLSAKKPQRLAYCISTIFSVLLRSIAVTDFSLYLAPFCFAAFNPCSGAIDQRKCGIHTTDLPRPFQDAVRITYALAVHYLWIDSLCIYLNRHRT